MDGIKTYSLPTFEEIRQESKEIRFIVLYFHKALELRASGMQFRMRTFKRLWIEENAKYGEGAYYINEYGIEVSFLINESWREVPRSSCSNYIKIMEKIKDITKITSLDRHNPSEVAFKIIAPDQQVDANAIFIPNEIFDIAEIRISLHYA